MKSLILKRFSGIFSQNNDDSFIREKPKLKKVVAFNEKLSFNEIAQNILKQRNQLKNG